MKRLLAIVLIIIALLTFIVLPAIAATDATGVICAVCGRSSGWKKCSGQWYGHKNTSCSITPSTCGVVEIYYATAVECDYGCSYILLANGTQHYEYEYHSVCFNGMHVGGCEVAYTY